MMRFEFERRLLLRTTLALLTIVALSQCRGRDAEPYHCPPSRERLDVHPRGMRLAPEGVRPKEASAAREDERRGALVAIEERAVGKHCVAFCAVGG
jgi:hypothetical protein